MPPRRSSRRRKFIARRSQKAEEPGSEQTAYAPFDTLPDELVLQIIQMVVESERKCYEYDHHDLTQVIAKTSTRFQRIALTKSFWTGDIRLYLSTDPDQQMRELEVLNDEVLSLQLSTCRLERSGSHRAVIKGGVISGDHPKAVAERCPNLETFELEHEKMGAWPSFETPWMALEYLKLSSVEMCDAQVFNNVSEFHRYFPNLETLKIAKLLIAHQLDRTTSGFPTSVAVKNWRELKLIADVSNFPKTMVAHFPED